MFDLPPWIATASHSIKIGEYVAKLFKTNLKPKEQLGVARITPVIFCGQAGGYGEYEASNDPNAPRSHIVPVNIPTGARIVNAWYSPLHNIPGMLAFALIDVEPHNNTDICLKVAAFPNIPSRMRIAVNVLYATR
jgi:hypothetical protein